MHFPNQLRFTSGKEYLILHTQPAAYGVNVAIDTNVAVNGGLTPHKVNRFIPDTSLSRHIGQATYNAFHRLVRDKRHNYYDFTPTLIWHKPTPDQQAQINIAIQKIRMNPVTSHVALWNYLRKTHAAIITLISSYSWIDKQDQSKDLAKASSISTYIENTLIYITANSPSVISQLGNYLQEQFRHVKPLFISDNKIEVSYGIDLPVSNTDANTRQFDEFLASGSSSFVWLFWIILIGALIFGAILLLSKGRLTPIR